MVAKLYLGLVLLGILVMVGCGGSGDYDEVVAVNTKFIGAMETYLEDVEKADSASAMADAIDAYAEKMEEIAPQMKAVIGKYPELKDNAKVPEELKALQERSAAMAEKIPASFMKAMKYVMDPEVQEAQKRLQQAMAKMQ
ncbi:MAG: hypothetical protein PVH87_17090 [Desulfobacteraceae bacterium]|jgi:hypothetical protein